MAANDEVDLENLTAGLQEAAKQTCIALISMGFDGDSAVTAATIFEGDVAGAVEFLADQVAQSEAFSNPLPPRNDALASDPRRPVVSDPSNAPNNAPNNASNVLLNNGNNGNNRNNRNYAQSSEADEEQINLAIMDAIASMNESAEQNRVRNEQINEHLATGRNNENVEIAPNVENAASNRVASKEEDELESMSPEDESRDEDDSSANRLLEILEQERVEAERRRQQHQVQSRHRSQQQQQRRRRRVAGRRRNCTRYVAPPVSYDDIAMNAMMQEMTGELEQIVGKIRDRKKREYEEKVKLYSAPLGYMSKIQSKSETNSFDMDLDYNSKDRTQEEIAQDEKNNDIIRSKTQLELSEDDIVRDDLVHKAVWFQDSLALKNYPVPLLSVKDRHGNTPLALAVRLGHTGMVNKLLSMGADPRIEMECGWNIMQEAVLHKDQHLVRDLLIHEIELRGNEYQKREQAVLEALAQMPNFYLEIKWQVQSSIPMLTNLLSNIANIDNFKIWKKGANIRFDSFMRGFSGSGVEKGHLSFVFNEGHVIAIDHDRQQFENAVRKFKNPDFDELQYQLRVLLKTEQGRAAMRTSHVKFAPKKDLLRRPRVETIEGYECNVLSTTGLSYSVVTVASDEKDWIHPDFEDYFFSSPAGANASHAANGTNGDITNNAEDGDAVGTIFDDTEALMKSESNGGKRSSVGSVKSAIKKIGKKGGKKDKKERKDKMNKKGKKYYPAYIKTKEQPVDVTLWLSKDYPLSDEHIRIILECISIASEDMRRLADIFELNFPGGFPVKLDIPVIVGISAGVTFCNFQVQDCDDELFKVPEHYRLR